MENFLVVNTFDFPKILFLIKETNYLLTSGCILSHERPHILSQSRTRIMIGPEKSSNIICAQSVGSGFQLVVCFSLEIQ